METCEKCGENTASPEVIKKRDYEVVVCKDCYEEYLDED
jgi:ribosome-binding protein aMBF1 (putative translation factor)